MIQAAKRFTRLRFSKPPRESGQGMTEYLIITALIAVAAIAVFALFGQAIRNQVSGLAMEVSGQGASTQIQSSQTSANNAVTNAKQGLTLKNYNDGGNTKVQSG